MGEAFSRGCLGQRPVGPGHLPLTSPGSRSPNKMAPIPRAVAPINPPSLDRCVPRTFSTGLISLQHLRKTGLTIFWYLHHWHRRPVHQTAWETCVCASPDFSSIPKPTLGCGPGDGLQPCSSPAASVPRDTRVIPLYLVVNMDVKCDGDSNQATSPSLLAPLAWHPLCTPLYLIYVGSGPRNHQTSLFSLEKG